MKHTPATPLPWRRAEAIAGRYPSYPIVNNDNLPITNLAVMAHGRAGQDAAYIAHAANAYPRLVAEARESQVTLAIALDALRKANLPGQEAAVLEQINATSALLRELGEDA